MNYKSDFDLDLSTGEQGESLVRDMLQISTIEVKTDFLASTTGNIAVEYESRGKQSGISVTKASHWVFVIPNKIAIFVEINQLKEIARKYYKEGSIRSGGDLDSSRLILIPIKELFND